MAAPRGRLGRRASQGAAMPSSDYQHIRFEVEPSGVATLTFNLPRMANAMDLLGVQETLDALRQCEKRSDVGAVVLTGAGEHAFSAGFNLKEIPFADWQPEQIRSHFETLAMWWHQALHRIVHLPRPVLAAVNGVAAGVGLGMTLAADMAVAVDSATFLCAWHSIGLANDAATSYSLVKVVGFRRAMELMLTNRTLSAAEALDWQILNRVYPRADFQRNVAQIADDLAAGPTHLQAMAKSRFHAGWRQSIEECTEMEIENVMESITHPYFKETLDRFLSKRARSDKVQVRLPPGQGEPGVPGSN
jgi:enoyl-CoA hydratase/carnithine racemase